jgi:RHS repeat-associated protein
VTWYRGGKRHRKALRDEKEALKHADDTVKALDVGRGVSLALGSSELESYHHAKQTLGGLTNPTTFNVGGVSRSPSFNGLNQLIGSTPSGSRVLGVTGALNGAATVTVNGAAATVNSGHFFAASTSLTPGSANTVAVVATDSSGNSRTNHYQVNVPSEPTFSPTFDADGNELTDGAGRTFTWDAKNELASVSSGGSTATFAYDALGRRISETDSGALTKQWVWDGARMAEERNSSNVVTRRFYGLGEQIGGTAYFYTRDHLGSVVEMTGSTGALQARYDYDPYGRTTLVSGTNLSDFQYAGYYAHQPSGLNLTLFRAYDPNTAKWLSRDPLGEGSDATLYSYVWNDPIEGNDPLGLAGGGRGSGGKCPCGQHPIPLYQALGYPSALAATSTTFFNANSGAAQAWLAGATASGAVGNFPGVVNTGIGKAAKGGAAATVAGVAAAEAAFYLYLLSHFAGNVVCVPN